MMTSKKSNRVIKFNYLLAPVILIVSACILFFNFQINGPISSSPEVMPVYKNGNSSLYRTVGDQIKYPLEARKKNVQGTVYVSFNVNKKGEITEIKSEQNKYNLLEEVVVVGYADAGSSQTVNTDLSVIESEAERVIKLLGDFTPGEKDGKPVSVRLTLPITFKID
jgi:protein TonB